MIDHTPRRVLILSDSKNMTFDCSILREPVVAFRENLFYLRDLYKHKQSIEQTDIVLISAGINDMRHKKASPITLHNHLRAFTSQFKTEFLFDSISPLSMCADRFNNLNNAIDNCKVNNVAGLTQETLVKTGNKDVLGANFVHALQLIERQHNLILKRLQRGLPRLPRRNSDEVIAYRRARLAAHLSSMRSLCPRSFHLALQVENKLLKLTIKLLYKCIILIII